jgi:hypothetical protein
MPSRFMHGSIAISTVPAQSLRGNNFFISLLGIDVVWGFLLPSTWDFSLTQSFFLMPHSTSRHLKPRIPENDKF